MKFLKKSDDEKRPVAFIIIIAAIVVVCVLGFFYYQNYVYYSKHFYNATSINGIDVSDLTVEETEDLIQGSLDSYMLTLTDRDGRTSQLSADEIGLTYSKDGGVSDALQNQKPSLWLINSGKPSEREITVNVSYDDEVLKNWIDSLPCICDSSAPTDAYEEIGADDYYYIVPETEGNMADIDKLDTLVVQAVKSGTETLDLADEDCYLSPSVRSDDAELVAFVEETNAEIKYQKTVDKITNVSVTLEMGVSSGSYNGGVSSSVLDQETLKTMIVDDDEGNPTISKDNVVDWVQNWANENALTDDEYLFVTYEGSLVHLSAGSDVGWKLQVQATADEVYDAVCALEDTVVSAVLADADDGSLLSESTYVEIIIPEQRMLLHVNGEIIVDTPVVTGNVAKNYDTPSNGIWHIFLKTTNYTLKGYNPDGSLMYSVFVNYWMPFNNGVGIHDISSRSSYGGTIYLYSGSHGCVNTPLSAVKTIYSYVSVGTKVIVWG